MSYTPTSWQDRIVQFAQRFKITYPDSSEETVTIEPEPGNVTEAGTPVNAANLNQLEQGLSSHTSDSAHQAGRVYGYQNLGGGL